MDKRGRSAQSIPLLWMETVPMNDSKTTISEIKETLAAFDRQRGWGAGHTALNLAISISLEASELLEIFQWCGPEEANKAARKTEREHFMEELADVMIYCIKLANRFDVDVAGAIEDKMKKNAEKYPVQQL